MSRSSNSPRNFVPAMSAPMSSAMTRLFLRLSRHVALHDAQRQPFGDRRLADARLADEHGVVLRAPREHLDHAANFLVAADHRVELALAGPARPGRCRISPGPGTCPSGVWSVTRALPRTACSASRTVVLGDRVELAGRSWPSTSSCASASSRCSVETNSSFIAVGFACGRVEHLAKALARAAAATPPLDLAADASARPRRCCSSWPTLAPIFSSTGRTMPSLFASSAAKQMQRLDLRIARARRRAPAPRCTASWALIVSLSKRNAMVGFSSRSVSKCK